MMSRHLRRAVNFFLAGLALLIPPASASAQWIQAKDIPRPLLDNDPFDLLYLNDAGGHAILKIYPQKKHASAGQVQKGGILVFRFVEGFDETLQVPLASLKEHKTFNELLIDEADEWLKKGNYPSAFRNLLYVYDHGGKNDSKLVRSLKECLFLDGKQNLQEGRYELALSIFEDIYRQDPGFQVPGIQKKLIDIIFLCYDGILNHDFENNRFTKVQQQIATIENKYPDDAISLLQRWQKNFEIRAEEFMKQARSYAADGNGRQAHLAARRAEQVAPHRADIKELQEAILQQYPLIVVGVSQSGADADGRRLEHWGARRVGRLIQRTIIEMTGLTDEGGKYQFLNGDFTQADESGLRYVLELAPQPAFFATPPANAYQIASRLLEAANPQSPSYDEAWAKVVKTIALDGRHKIIIDLRTPFVRPEALLDMPYQERPTSQSETNGSQAARLPQQNGIYVALQSNQEVTTFDFNPMYQRLPGRQHPVLIEHLYSSASSAVDELLEGNIDVVDRISIGDLARIREANNLIVRPYALPTVHMLVPKIRGPLKDNPYFRSGLSHAIDRQTLLHKAICDGQIIDGCEIVSGPFPIGTQDNDQISYGYDLRVRPLIYNTKLAMVLNEIALRPTAKRTERLPLPTLVLAHSDSSAAQEASEAIALMWSQAGVSTTTRKLPSGETQPADDLWDLLYVEATLEEPLADVTELIGKHGLATDISAPAEQTLRQISYARSWRSATSNLRRLHRQLAVDQSIIPLWQVQEFYAYRNTVRGIGRDLIHLYQNVDRWQIDSTASDEKQ